ncbi:hypothetical protein GLOIN_2v1870260 [Rhizophagus irregularis DAOM 181602=DAOM 197198]|nr:hypothetical protein GLOIN_2v1870260 [Rhizophagus irregularis DAOM 181602=DAOM 197198]GBC42450.2 hypothetical protein GLOIN_2v1870260 [Rhizophagus irregularis DAOM 181602=DAOM 197198]
MQECITAWKEVREQNTSFIENKINEYYNTIPPTIHSHQNFFLSHRTPRTPTASTSTPTPTPPKHTSIPQHITTPRPIVNEFIDTTTIQTNARSQQNVANKINSAIKNISECQQMVEITTDESLKVTLKTKIIEEEHTLSEQRVLLSKLKRHAEAQSKLRTKKKKLIEEGVVEQYNTPGRPSAAMKDPELWDKIHDSVEFGAAHAKRRKVVIKVRTIKHLRETLEEKYNTYLSRQCLSTYLQPRHQNTFAARRHHHPAKVGLASVARTDMKSHVDEHYCLASVKAAKIFAEVFADESIIISQDDKAKIGLGIPAVGRTFKTIQSVNEPVTVEDHDFPTGSKMKLIPSVYLVINPADSSNTLRTGQLFIFIRPEYFIGTSSATHIADLESIIKNENFSNTLKKEDKVRPIWVLLVDGGPDENPKHMKNIIQYAHLFRSLDLDYLTVRTHAPGQSAYNPVERSMASLSEKLAGITLPIEEFGSHLNSQGNVIDEELARRNFEYSGNKLCDIWKRDDIHGKPVTVEYVDQERNPFDEPEPSISWEWIEEHTQLCRYSLDIKKCKNRECCSEYRAPDAAKLLDENNGFLSPTTKGKDGHFINPIHALQYHDKLKILEYDRCCPSIPQELHQRLCCDICGKYFPTLKFIKEHKRNIHSHYNKRRTQQKRNSKRTANETEMECVVIPLNFNVAEDIIQRNPWQEIEQDVREVQSDRE